MSKNEMVDVTNMRQKAVDDGFMRNSSFTYNYIGKEKIRELVDAEVVFLYIKPCAQGFVHLAIFADPLPVKGGLYYDVGIAVTMSRDDIYYGHKPYWTELYSSNGIGAYDRIKEETDGFLNIADRPKYVRKHFNPDKKIYAKVRAFFRVIRHAVFGQSL